MRLARCVADERSGGQRVDVDDRGVWHQVNVDGAAANDGTAGHGNVCCVGKLMAERREEDAMATSHLLVIGNPACVTFSATPPFC